MLQCVIFDMDGVIIDSEPLHYQVFEIHCRDLGFKAAEEDYNAFIGCTDLDMYAFLKEKYGLYESAENLVEYKRTLFVSCLLNADIKPIPAVEPLIRQLSASGIQLALASSSEMEVIRLVLDKFNMGKLFDVVVSGTELQRSKPAPDIFLRTAALLNAEPRTCMVIEDSRNGVAAAKAAGMKCIGFQNPNSGNQDLSAADRIISHFSEIDIRELISSLL